MKSTMKSVSTAEFDTFIGQYPRPLQARVLAEVNPTRVQFADAKLGVVVASHAVFKDRKSRWTPTRGDFLVIKNIPAGKRQRAHWPDVLGLAVFLMLIWWALS
jgi:hypothetical protein